MNKVRMVFVAAVLLLNMSGLALSAQPGTPEYEKLKEYKKVQREKKKNPAPAGEKGFWQKEAERSGFAGTAAMFSNAVTGVIPLDKPNSRK